MINFSASNSLYTAEITVSIDNDLSDMEAMLNRELPEIGKKISAVHIRTGIQRNQFHGRRQRNTSDTDRMQAEGLQICCQHSEQRTPAALQK